MKFQQNLAKDLKNQRQEAERQLRFHKNWIRYYLVLLDVTERQMGIDRKLTPQDQRMGA